MQFTPRDYQQSIVDHIIQHPSAFVLAQMGAGKTAATLEALRHCKCKRVLLVAPLRVAQHTWPNEIAKWDNFKNFPFAVAVGTAKKRKEAVEARKALTIINTENLVWLLDNFDNDTLDFDMIIIDESSMFKSQSSKRFKTLRKWRNKSQTLKRVVLLTATPTPNSLLEIWPQVTLLDGGERLGTAFTKFRERYFDSDYMGYKWTPKAHAEQSIHNKVKDLSIVVERYDGLPERVDLVESVELPAQAKKYYKELVDNLMLELDGADITAVNAAVLVGKLQQIAGGAVYDETGAYEIFHDEKLKALESLLIQAEGENVIVAYNYKHEYERIIEKFPHAVSVKEKGAIDRWNNGEIRMLVAHPASMAHGINAQQGGRRIIWYSPTWSNELDAQFNARLHRQGQTDTVFIHKIVANGTVDSDIIDAVTHKRTVQDLLLEAVKQK